MLGQSDATARLWATFGAGDEAPALPTGDTGGYGGTAPIYLVAHRPQLRYLTSQELSEVEHMGKLSSQYRSGIGLLATELQSLHGIAGIGSQGDCQNPTVWVLCDVAVRDIEDLAYPIFVKVRRAYPAVYWGFVLLGADDNWREEWPDGTPPRWQPIAPAVRP